MPVAKIFVPAATLSAEQRQEIVRGVHDVINGVETRAAGAQTYVLIHEFPTGDWGSAGDIYQPRSR